MLNNLARNFFWKKSDTQKGLPLISWDRICQPKARGGGLGLRKDEATNKAFQCKLAWKILTNANSCWVQAMKTKYLTHSTLLDYKIKPTDSSVWNNVLPSRNLLISGLTWQIGDGSNISFWFDY